MSLTSCYNQETIVDKSQLLGNDIRLYQNTPAWNLAKAVDAEDIVKIKQEVNDNKVNVDLKETRFGHTLLSMAVRNNKYESVKTLLELGADPNAADSYMGTTPMIYATQNDDLKYLKLLLSFKGNPNSAESAPPIKGNIVRSTALVKSTDYTIINSLEKVKMLVEAGANVNFDNDARTNSPLSNALTMGKMDVVLYLLQQGANYKREIYTTIDNEKVYILEALKEKLFDLESEQYQQKLKVIEFLKTKGLDYDKEPIPLTTLEEIKNKYPDSWEDYIKRY